MSQTELSNDAVGRVSTEAYSLGAAATDTFIDRRSVGQAPQRAGERRQFGSSHLGLSDDGRELAMAIDQYKVQNHRRYLTCDEMLSVLRDLGYQKRPG